MTLNLACLPDCAEECPALKSCGFQPEIDSQFAPHRHRDRPHVATFADEVSEHPMFLSKFEVFNLHGYKLGSS